MVQMTVFHDGNEQKFIEETGLRDEILYNLLLSQDESQVLISLYDQNDVLRYANKSWRAAFHLAPGERSPGATSCGGISMPGSGQCSQQKFRRVADIDPVAPGKDAVSRL